MTPSRALPFFTTIFSLLAASCGAPSEIGASCTLEPCGVGPGGAPDDANLVCDLATECPALMCLSYRSDGAERAPFCSAECVPGGSGGCPRDLDGNPGVCVVAQEVVAPGETSNCTAGGYAARCACVPCCEIDPAMCRDPGACG